MGINSHHHHHHPHPIAFTTNTTSTTSSSSSLTWSHLQSKNSALARHNTILAIRLRETRTKLDQARTIDLQSRHSISTLMTKVSELESQLSVAQHVAEQWKLAHERALRHHSTIRELGSSTHQVFGSLISHLRSMADNLECNVLSAWSDMSVALDELDQDTLSIETPNQKLCPSVSNTESPITSSSPFSNVSNHIITEPRLPSSTDFISSSPLVNSKSSNPVPKPSDPWALTTTDTLLPLPPSSPTSATTSYRLPPVQHSLSKFTRTFTSSTMNAVDNTPSTVNISTHMEPLMGAKLSPSPKTPKSTTATRPFRRLRPINSNTGLSRRRGSRRL